jgi:hypothetical protein
MNRTTSLMWARSLLLAILALALAWGQSQPVAAHCDTLDGPVISDARTALDRGDVTPVLKWVRPKDEKRVTNLFRQTLVARGKKGQQKSETAFFTELVRIHRAGEGESFTGLKPTGAVEPVIAAADKALASGSADELVMMVTEAVSQGIRQRYEKVAEASRHKDESVAQGRAFVAAYVDYTHYLERLHQTAGEATPHHGGDHHKGLEAPHQHH